MVDLINLIYKVLMSRAIQAVRIAMHERGEATRPQLATATGLSLVSVGKAVNELCLRGELQMVGEIPSGGGRPVQLYRYNTSYAVHVVTEVTREGQRLNCELSVLDLHGNKKSGRRVNFTYLEKESLDGVMAEAVRRNRVRSITIPAAPELIPAGLPEHLAEIYHCEVAIPDVAELLAAAVPNETAVLYLPEGGAPSCAFKRRGRVERSGPLHLLPLPELWQTLDYKDRSLVAEMTARYIQIVACMLTPARIKLYTPLWSSRLTERIRYTAATKMKEYLPELSFEHMSHNLLSRATTSAIIRLTK